MAYRFARCKKSVCRGRKSDAAFPLAAIKWCLDHAGLEPEELDAVVFYERPMLKFERILTCALRAFPRSWRAFPKAMQNSLGEKVWVRGIISSHLGVPGRKVLFTEHHQSHAAAAFLTAPTRRAAILTTDGVGEWATLAVGHGERREDGTTAITLLREIRFPHSLGMLYSTFTAYLGFAVNEDEYKVMGLAGFGRPTMVDQVRKVIRRTPDGAFTLDLDYFEFHTTTERSYSQRFIELFGPPRNSYEPIDLETAEGRRFADCAASVQRVLEDTLVDMARALRQETGLTDLCLGGGVALNGVANARILAESGFERVFVPSAPGDAGCALGAALYADRIHFGNPDREVPDHPFWGPPADGVELARLAREDGHPFEELDDGISDRANRRRSSGRPRRRLDGRGPRTGAACPRSPQHSGRAACRGDAGPTQSRHQVSRGVSTVCAGRADRIGGPLLRIAAGRAAPGALHVGGFPGASGVAGAAGGGYARGRHSAVADAIARYGAALVQAAGGIRTAYGHSGAAQHLV